MSIRRILTGATLALATAAVANAQIVTTGPFTGTQSEGFETQNSPGFNMCIIGRVFSGTADLCTPGGAHTLISSGWSFMCTIQERSGARFYGSAGGYTEITFDTPATSFGGYFGTNSGSPDGKAAFYDDTGAFLGSFLITAPADCNWYWNGWTVTGGNPIKRVELYGGYSSGGFLDMDDLEVNYGPSCPTSTYCIAKTNSLGCVPAIGATGQASATATSGFKVDCTMVRNNKSGLLFYKVNGTQAGLTFQCGTLCVGPSGIKRTPAQSAGGNPPPANDCSGAFALDMNAFASGMAGGNPDPALQTVAAIVHCQWWGRDQGFPAPCNTTLSDGLEYTVCP